MAARGMFITFEGGDGSGKSTQIQSVRDWFESRGREVIVTREPGGTELGTEIRRLVQNGPEDVDARTEALLYAADRAYHVATVIRPALERGAVVLGDRYIDSSLAYQGAARSLGVDEIASLSAWATQGLYPSLTFLLDLPPEVGARRRTDAPDRMERESMDFHERVRHEYLRLADAEPERIVVIDAVGTVDEVFSEIRGVLVERFDGGSSTIDEAVDGSAGSVTAPDAGAEAPAEAPAESEDAAPEVASPEASTDEAPPADAPEASAPDTTDEETATDEAAPVLVDAPAPTATRKRRAAKASHKDSTEKRSSRKPATMVGALGESQGALWDE
ncbi:dTMP kinase [Pauljensenia sp. 20925_1_25]|uniref:dTMP kinase n=1 Tax=Pauljensenia sp. 20925_1_25 TaxID=3003692 RepID=UPI00352C9E9B